MAKIGKRKLIRSMKRKKSNVDTKFIASCYGKIRRTKQDAHEAAELRPSIVKPYKCKYCGYWHIGRRNG